MSANSHDLPTYLTSKGWSDLAPKLAQNGVTRMEDLEGKTEVDYFKMGVPMRRAQQLAREFSYAKTPVGERLLSAGFNDQVCKNLYENDYRTLEAARDLNTRVLELMGIRDNEARRLLNLFMGDRKYAVFISHAHAAGAGAAQILYERLDQEFTGERIFYDLQMMQDLNQLQEDVRRSKAMLSLLSSAYFSSAYCILELLVAYEWNIPICPCIVEANFDRNVFNNLDACWDNLRPVGNYTAHDFLRRRGVSRENFNVVMAHLQNRITVDFTLGINPAVQQGQLVSIINSLRACHVEYAKRPERMANPRRE